MEELHEYYMMGEITEEERYQNVIHTWEETTKNVVKALQAGFDRYKPHQDDGQTRAPAAT